MKKIFTILSTLLISFSLFSCMTIKEIPNDKSAIQILQMGQNAASTGSYSNAEFCYNTVIDRYGDDPLILVQAKYELGHIYTKEKKYEKATNHFNDIINIYNSIPGQIPPKYKKLSEMGLERIEKETTKNSSKKNKIN